MLCKLKGLSLGETKQGMKPSPLTWVAAIEPTPAAQGAGVQEAPCIRTTWGDEGVTSWERV